MQECPISRRYAIFGFRAASTLALPRRERAVLEHYYYFHGNMAIFLYALETVVKSQGGSAKVAKQTQLEPKTIANLLASDEAPPIDTLGARLNAPGCRLTIRPLNACERATEPEAAHVEKVA